MPTFNRDIKVRFAHTDAAGIMFYPRYFGLVNDVVEDWFGDGIGFDFKHLHIDEKRAVPTAHIKADFFRPSFMHDKLTFSLNLTKLGTSSISLIVRAASEGEDRLKVSLILVHMDMVSGKSLPWPDDMRAAMQKWLPEGPDLPIAPTPEPPTGETP
jgi:4-hydroxybenzoyl-CoA thioesterase